MCISVRTLRGVGGVKLELFFMRQRENVSRASSQKENKIKNKKKKKIEQRGRSRSFRVLRVMEEAWFFIQSVMGNEERTLNSIIR